MAILYGFEEGGALNNKTLLLVMGLTFLALALGSWYSDRGAGSSEVVETFGRGIVKETSEPVETTEEREDLVAPSPGTMSTSTSRTMIGGTASKSVTSPPTKRITTRTASPSSETLTLGLLGLGSAFLIASAFYDRISAIKFPGGEVTLVEGTKNLEEAVGELRTSQEALKDALRKLAGQRGQSSGGRHG